MTISSSEIRRNMTILLDGEVHQILEWQHRQAPKAPPTLTLKVRHLATGNVFERKMQGNHKLTAAPTDRRKSQFIYQDGDFYVFMDMETFDQHMISAALMREAKSFLKDGAEVTVLFHDGNALLVEMPPSVVLEVASTEVGLKGDTQSGATKPATLESGHTLQVPLFINTGERISVNTTTGEYIGRAD